MTTTHLIPSELLEISRYGDGIYHSSDDLRIMVRGQSGVGFALGYVPPTASARKVTGGPLVSGPWCYAVGLCAVIDNYGGSRAEIDQSRARGSLIECEAGDLLEIDGNRYSITFARNGADRANLSLELVGPVERMGLCHAATVLRVKSDGCSSWGAPVRVDCEYYGDLSKHSDHVGHYGGQPFAWTPAEWISA